MLRRGRPGLALVDELARTQLRARRLGCRIELRDACAELWALLDLVGLTDVVTAARRGLRQVDGEAEDGEEVGVHEGVEPDDPVA